MERWRGWWQSVCAGLDAGAAPGGAVCVVHRDRVVLHQAHGFATLQPRPEPLHVDLRFDLASITKAIATTSCVMALWAEGRLDLDAPVAEALPEFGRRREKRAVTPLHLLSHTSGLPAGRPLYLWCGQRATLRRAVLDQPLRTAPGCALVYSDLGFLTLGFLVEAVAGQRQDVYLAQRILSPLGLADALGYCPDESATTVATESCRWGRHLVRGVVHDENAWRCEGVAGHAGLFGTAAAVAAFGQDMLTGRALPATALAEVFAPRTDPAAERFWLGWKRLQFGPADPAAFGHDGFTGTLLWVSPRRKLVVALLTNRVHPSRANRRIYDLRPGWLTAAAELAEGSGDD